MCGTVVWVKLILIRFFFADSIPLRMACGTSLALPAPCPTTAAEGSPTTTSAANERFLPPFTTLVTRLMATTWSFNWYEFASSFLTTVGILHSHFAGFKLPNYPITKLLNPLKLQPAFARRISQRLHPPVINVATAVKNHFSDALGLGTLRNCFAQCLRGRHVAARTPVFLLALGRTRRNQR